MLPDGRAAFTLIENASDGNADALVFFMFDALSEGAGFGAHPAQ